LDDVIRVEDRYYILATSSLADDRTRVLKHRETFAVFDRYGDIQTLELGEQGLYHEGTRFLSCFVLRVGRDRPLLLSSTVRDDNTRLTVDLTNPDFTIDGQVTVPRGSLHIFRTKFLWQGTCYERLQIYNYGLMRLDLPLHLHFDTDFADIFEVRGVRRERRGHKLEAVVKDDGLVLGYAGLDGVIRRTRLQCSPAPAEVLGSELRIVTRLSPKEGVTFDLTVSCESAEQPTSTSRFDIAAPAAENALQWIESQDCEIYTSNEQFNDWLNRSRTDLHLMISQTPYGLYPYAGIPWFSTVFGRDGIITALECLWMNPNIAQGVLAYLAAAQATEVIPFQDAEPGKILHETRRGDAGGWANSPV
jgi:glycogen debranching enzyme